MSTNPFATECTRYDLFRKEITSDLEYAMHKTWRANAQMLDLANGEHPWPTRDEIIDRLTMAINELSLCRDIMLGTKSDHIGYYDEKKEKIGNYEMSPSEKDKTIN